MQCVSCHCESSWNTFSERDRSNESGNRFESNVRSVLRFADPANVGKSLLDGNKDHLLTFFFKRELNSLKEKA